MTFCVQKLSSFGHFVRKTLLREFQKHFVLFLHHFQHRHKISLSIRQIEISHLTSVVSSARDVLETVL